VVNVNLGVTPQDRVVDSPPDSIVNGELVHIAASSAAPAARP
jgi:hypothetical protein